MVIINKLGIKVGHFGEKRDDKEKKDKGNKISNKSKSNGNGNSSGGDASCC